MSSLCNELKIFLKLMFLCVFVVEISSNKKNQFILEYFKYRKIPHLVGLTCNQINHDILLIKDLNRANIGTSFHKLLSNTSIKLLARAKYRKLGVVIDGDCHKKYDVQSIFSDASLHSMFDALHHWLILSSDLKSILQVVEDRAFGVSTDFVISITSNNGSYQLYDAYNICKEHGMQINVTYFGTWNESHGFNVSLVQEKFPRRSNLHKVHLKAIYLKQKNKPADVDLLTHLQTYRLPISDGQHKYGFSILSNLAYLHNFSLTHHEATKASLNDTFGQHARTVARNLVDFSGTPFIISHKRLDFLKFVHSDWPLRTCFIFRNPQPQNIKVQEILRPFANEIWYGISAVMIINIVTFALLLSYEDSGNSNLKLSNSILVNVGSLCQQNVFEKISRSSTRIALLFIMIFAFVIDIYYSSSVVSARLNDQIFKINDSLIQFGKLHLPMASEWMDILKLLLSVSDYETRLFYNNYWLKIPESKWFMEPREGMHLVKQGGFAYHTQPETAYPYIDNYFDNNEVCELGEVHLTWQLTTFAVRYNSTITEIARVGLTKISEVGLRNRELLRWRNRKATCRTDILSAASITINEFAPHLILLALGMGMALFLSIMEFIMLKKPRIVSTVNKIVRNFNRVKKKFLRYK